MMKIFDLHCDTLLKGTSFAGNTGHIDLDRLPANSQYCQCFAMFIHDRYRLELAIEEGEKLYSNFQQNMEELPDRICQVRTTKDIDEAFAANKVAALLTIENSSIFAGDLDRINLMAERGVRLASLTWNGANELAGGASAYTEWGLTDFGRQAIGRMEELGIILDVSHANDKSFWETVNLATKPFIASHSNCRSVCNHRRNLTDDQIREIGRMGGVIGLNYYINFLKEDGEVAGWDDLLRHIDRMLELAGDKVPALGSDFDGAKTPPFLQSVADEAGLYDAICRSSLGKTLADRIFFDNAYEFFKKFD
ncbi:MAG: membrane dipeptidase [Clostridiales bacterium]